MTEPQSRVFDPLSSSELLSSQQKVLEKLESYALYSGRLVGLFGPHKSGKTFVLNALLKNLPSEVSVRYIDCRQADWLKQMFEALGINSAAARQSLTFGLNQLTRQQDILIVLDHADVIEPIELEKLALKAADHVLNCIVAFNSETERRDWFSKDLAYTVTLFLEPLSEGDAVSLMSNTLGLNLSQLLSMFPEKLLDHVIEKANGNPSEIIRLSALLTKKMGKTPGRSANKVNGPLWGVVAVAAVIAIWLNVRPFFSQEQGFEQSTIDEASKEIDDNRAPKQLEATVESASSETSEPSSSAALAVKPDNPLNDENQLDGNKVEKDSSATEQTTSRIASSDKHDDLSDAQAKLKEPSPETLPSTPSRVDDAALGQKERYLSPTTKTPISEVAEAGVIEATSELQTKTQHQSDVEVLELSGSSTDKPSQSSLPSRTNDAEISPTLEFNSQENYLLSISDEQWFIQLAGFAKLDNVADFIEKNRTVGALHFYRSIRNGEFWYVVLLGPYGDQELAARAQATLPPNLARNKPWIKPANQIKEAIRRR